MSTRTRPGTALGNLIEAACRYDNGVWSDSSVVHAARLLVATEGTDGSLVFPIPLRGSDDRITIVFPRHLEAEHWDHLLAILDVIRPSLVNETRPAASTEEP